MSFYREVQLKLLWLLYFIQTPYLSSINKAFETWEMLKHVTVFFQDFETWEMLNHESVFFHLNFEQLFVFRQTVLSV